MQVLYDEGVANHIGPKPCAGVREDVGEASAGERAGQPLSRKATCADAPAPSGASPSHPRGRSRMLESGSSGSVRGASSNGRPLYVASVRQMIISAGRRGKR